jgi:hypothetical protein
MPISPSHEGKTIFQFFLVTSETLYIDFTRNMKQYNLEINT